MRLTRFTGYALRVLIFVALKENSLARIDEIAGSYGISKNHLRKVVHDLSTRGYIDTVQGRRGGIRLSRPANRINVGDVVRQMEQDTSLSECFDPARESCCISPACVLRSVLHDALDEFFAALGRYTLADLVRPRNALVELLRIAPVQQSGTDSAVPKQRATGRP